MTEVKKDDVVKILHTYPLCRVSAFCFSNQGAGGERRETRVNGVVPRLINKGIRIRGAYPSLVKLELIPYSPASKYGQKYSKRTIVIFLIFFFVEMRYDGRDETRGDGTVCYSGREIC